jgi:putative transposase
VDARGIPLSLVASGANQHDSALLGATLEAVVCARPDNGSIETLCADAAYVGYPALVTSRKHNYRLNVKTRRREVEEKQRNPQHKARRWVVERTHSWLNRFRKLLVSFEKTHASYTALLSLASALICWRQTIPIYG